MTWWYLCVFGRRLWMFPQFVFREWHGVRLWPILTWQLCCICNPLHPGRAWWLEYDYD